MQIHLAAMPLAVALAAVLTSDSVAQEPEQTLEFRLADDERHPNWKETEVRGDDRTIYISDEIIVDGSAVEKLCFHRNEAGNPVIGITLSEAGAEEMQKATAQNFGKRIAIVLGDEVVSAPIIRATFSREAMINGNFDNDDLLVFFRSIVLRKSPL